MKVAVAVGIGCDRGTPLATIARAFDDAMAMGVKALGAKSLDEKDCASDGTKDCASDGTKDCASDFLEVVAAASITLKADEIGLQEWAAQYGRTLIFYTPAELASVQVPNPSETVRRYTGTPSVSEAAALLVGASVGRAHGQALPMSALLVEKFKHRGVDGRNATISLARCDGLMD